MNIIEYDIVVIIEMEGEKTQNRMKGKKLYFVIGIILLFTFFQSLGN